MQQYHFPEQAFPITQQQKDIKCAKHVRKLLLTKVTCMKHVTLHHRVIELAMPACTHVCHNTFSIITVRYFFFLCMFVLCTIACEELQTQIREKTLRSTQKRKILFSQILQKFDNSYFTLQQHIVTLPYA